MASERFLPRWVRPFILTLLAAFFVSGLFHVEAWPLSGFRLFSGLRYDKQSRFRVLYVNEENKQRNVPFGKMPKRYGVGYIHVLKKFRTQTPAERDKTCEVWARETRNLGKTVQKVQVYLYFWKLTDREGDRARRATRRRLLYTCADTTAGRSS